MKKLLIVAALLFLGSIAFSEEVRTKKDSEWWLSLSQAKKIAYVENIKKTKGVIKMGWYKDLPVKAAIVRADSCFIIYPYIRLDEVFGFNNIQFQKDGSFDINDSQDGHYAYGPSIYDEDSQ